MYTYSALPKKLQDVIELDKNKIDKLQKKVGDWHDTCALITLLSHRSFPGKTNCISALKEKEEKQFKML